jgi:hypothetical protein
MGSTPSCFNLCCSFHGCGHSRCFDCKTDMTDGPEKKQPQRPAASSPRAAVPVYGTGYRVRDHVRPFQPYIEKATDSSVLERRPPNAPHGIDWATTRRWLEICQGSHRHCGPASIYHGRPDWLVDTNTHCIVAAGKLPYACLSYVWGAAPGEMLNLTNLSELQTERALASKCLPKTVNGAMVVVGMMGLRYLWVDRLCIVQDDVDAKQRQISAMADIYANAELTIIAAQGTDASFPLLFTDSALCEGGKTPSNKTLPKPYIDRRQYADTPTVRAPHEDIMNEMSTSLVSSAWYSRGWTWQEYLFSRRRLIFHDNTVNWDCHCASWHEGQTASQSPPGDYCTRKLGAATSNWPSFYRYARMVSVYNTRDLSYPEDVFDAFDGALSTLAPSFAGGFISGLPRLFFAAALLWQPYTPIMRRRIPSSPDKTNLPSWSWVGWQGDIYSEAWLSSCNYTMEEWNKGWEAAEVTPTTRWLFSEFLEGPRHAVSQSSVLPSGTSAGGGVPGWTRVSDGQTGVTYFQYSDISDQRFWYPVQIASESTPAPGPHHIRAKFLHGRARVSSKLKIEEVLTQQSEIHPLGSIASLRDKDGSWAGYLRPMNDEESDYLWHGNGKCTLVELSRSEVKNRGCPFLSGRGRMVNVMRVKRRQGVYRRLGLGRVEEVVWDAVAEEDDVTIG